MSPDAVATIFRRNMSALATDAATRRRRRAQMEAALSVPDVRSASR